MSRVWLVLATMGSVGLAAEAVPAAGRSSGVAFASGAFAALLACTALPSLPPPVAARSITIAGGLLAARFGTFSSLPVDQELAVLAWVLLTTSVFLASTTSERRPTGRRLARSWVSVLSALAVISATTFVAPSAIGRFNQGPALGAQPDPSRSAPGSPLAAGDVLDMRRRPRLSDRLVMTVRSPRAALWRTETYDRWDGKAWTRSNSQLDELGPGGEVQQDPIEAPPRAGKPIRAEYRIIASYASVLPAAPVAQRLELPRPAAQRPDGSLVLPFQPGGSGMTYAVTSLPPDTRAETLRAAAARPIPAPILRRYTTDVVAPGRVVRLAREITRRASTSFDAVVAIERWLAENTRYSIDAPLSPRGVDVVDHFLFESKVGWCEQVASSLVVLLRLNRIPARLATGFAPGTWNQRSRRFEVRELNAHAWTEVWFPGSGWVGFDPTAGVPFASTPRASATDDSWSRSVSGVVLAVALGALMVTALREARRVRRRQRQRLKGRSPAARAERRLERAGHRWGHPREPWETAGSYAARLGERRDEERIAEVGTLVDQARFGTEPVPDEQFRHATEALRARR